MNNPPKTTSSRKIKMAELSAPIVTPSTMVDCIFTAPRILILRMRISKALSLFLLSRQPDRPKSYTPHHTNNNKGLLQTRTVQLTDQHKASLIHCSRVPFQTRQVGVQVEPTHAAVQSSPLALQVQIPAHLLH